MILKNILINAAEEQVHNKKIMIAFLSFLLSYNNFFN